MSTECLQTLPEWQLSTVKTPIIERSRRKRLETPSTYNKCYEEQRKCSGYSWCVRTLPDSHLSTICNQNERTMLHTWYIATKHYQTQNSGSQSTRFLQWTCENIQEYKVIRGQARRTIKTARRQSWQNFVSSVNSRTSLKRSGTW